MFFVAEIRDSISSLESTTGSFFSRLRLGRLLRISCIPRNAPCISGTRNPSDFFVSELSFLIVLRQNLIAKLADLTVSSELSFAINPRRNSLGVFPRIQIS